MSTRNQKHQPTSTQSEKFKRAARELGCEDDEAAFDRALKQMKPPDKADKSEKDKPGH